MTHISQEQWKKYVPDEVDESQRERYDEHLYECDECLAVYLQVVEEHENELPTLSNEEDFTNLVMAKLSESKGNEESKKNEFKSVPFYQRATFHYTLAAAMTYLLMSAGVFQSISNYVGVVENTHHQQKVETSFTEGLVDKTFTWMDSLALKNKEGNNNE